MLKTILMMTAGFIAGLLLSENAQLIRHSIPRQGDASGNINQFVFILGIGNSGNIFEINIDDGIFEEDKEKETDD